MHCVICLLSFIIVLLITFPSSLRWIIYFICASEYCDLWTACDSSSNGIWIAAFILFLFFFFLLFHQFKLLILCPLLPLLSLSLSELNKAEARMSLSILLVVIFKQLVSNNSSLITLLFFSFIFFYFLFLFIFNPSYGLPIFFIL